MQPASSFFLVEEERTPMNNRNRRILTLIAGSVLVLSATGCVNKSGYHQEAVNSANERWRGTRTALMLQMAQRQFDAGDLEQATKSVGEAMSKDPENARLFLLSARISLEKGQLERAFRQLELAQQIDAQIPETYYYQGIVLQRWQEHQRAHAAYQKAYELEADNAAYLLATAEMLVALDRAGEARQVLEEKAMYFDQNAGIRTALGHLYVISREYDQAIVYFRQATILRPDDLQLVEDLAMALVSAGRHDEAIKELKRLLADEAYASRADLRKALAQEYQSGGRMGEAREALQDLKQRNSADVETWIKLAELSWMQGDLAATLSSANRIMSMAPDRQEGYVLAGMVWQKRGRTEEALKLFDRAADLSPQATEPVILRGITLQREGKHEAAAAAYQEALRRQPGDARAKELLASVPQGRE